MGFHEEVAFKHEAPFHAKQGTLSEHTSEYHGALTLVDSDVFPDVQT